MVLVKGLPTMQVARRLADQYDVKPNTIVKDIGRMDDWLPELQEQRPLSQSTASRLREQRKNRQRMHQMADEARRDDDLGLAEERRIRSKIDEMLETDIRLSQSVGETPRAPDEVEMRGGMQHAHVGVTGDDDTGFLSEQSVAHFERLEAAARDATAPNTAGADHTSKPDVDPDTANNPPENVDVTTETDD